MVSTIRFNARGVTLTGIFSPPMSETSRPLLICLHGGSYTSHYFNYRSQGSDTLIQLAPLLGFPVLALDRPGYAAGSERVMAFDAQAEILAEAATDARRQFAPASSGVFLVGHSIGAMIAMLMAAYHRPDALVGIDLSGAGLTYRTEGLAALSAFVAMTDPPRQADPVRRRGRMFGPPGTYDENVVAEDLAWAPLAQPAEIGEALAWQDRVHAVAADVECPVRCVVADTDALWEAGPRFEAAARAAFARSPLIDIATQHNAGHCLHLHHIARAANLRTLAFAAEIEAIGILTTGLTLKIGESGGRDGNPGQSAKRHSMIP
ncbi:alpha/beta fold hydrolase [Chelatococcus asaccharovorans]|uniref:alpha/beta fold hydrolase n=1 Tax=Chelatococcus asaccharovorans TaxID=28210 RepID=UPI00224C77DE|nr:alpha/beta hydrolase [Chelatococcus asaccharovorans]CAH1653337.1 putative Alpha/beta hydrolase family protein [Chelatococcus asaccharovorans]CAH1686075.1 putative Alpha/beta hydrolase family protein [Chelatococcus asaccharovorans]